MASFKKFQGVIHDTVYLRHGDPEFLPVDVTVIAGDEAKDTVSLRAWAGRTDMAFRMTADEAIALGRLLVAAGEDTQSRKNEPADVGTDEAEAV